MQSKVVQIMLVLMVAIGLLGVAYLVMRTSRLFPQRSNTASPTIPFSSPTSSPTLAPKTKDEIANWKTYKNVTYGFEFQYPPKLVVLENGKEAKEGTLSLGFQDHPFGLTIEKVRPSDPVNFLNVPKVAERRINGITWGILHFESNAPESGGAQTFYQTRHNDFRYVVMGYSERTRPEIDQILSTFRFTNPIAAPTTDPTADWKTHVTETENGLAFQYPANLILRESPRNFFLLAKDPTDPYPDFSIDARLTGTYSNYDSAILTTKEGLTDREETKLAGGIRFSGIVAGGTGQGRHLNIALFQHKGGAVSFETTSTDPEILKLFDQILPTFHFTN